MLRGRLKWFWIHLARRCLVLNTTLDFFQNTISLRPCVGHGTVESNFFCFFDKFLLLMPIWLPEDSCEGFCLNLVVGWCFQFMVGRHVGFGDVLDSFFFFQLICTTRLDYTSTIHCKISIIQWDVFSLTSKGGRKLIRDVVVIYSVVVGVRKLLLN